MARRENRYRILWVSQEEMFSICQRVAENDRQEFARYFIGYSLPELPADVELHTMQCDSMNRRFAFVLWSKEFEIVPDGMETPAFDLSQRYAIMERRPTLPERIEKLSPKPGEVLVLYFPAGMAEESRQNIMECLQGLKIDEAVNLVMMPDDMSLKCVADGEISIPATVKTWEGQNAADAPSAQPGDLVSERLFREGSRKFQATNGNGLFAEGETEAEALANLNKMRAARNAGELPAGAVTAASVPLIGVDPAGADLSKSTVCYYGPDGLIVGGPVTIGNGETLEMRPAEGATGIAGRSDAELNWSGGAPAEDVARWNNYCLNAQPGETVLEFEARTRVKSQERLALEYDLRQLLPVAPGGILDKSIENGPDLLLSDALRRAKDGQPGDAVRYLTRAE